MRKDGIALLAIVAFMLSACAAPATAPSAVAGAAVGGVAGSMIGDYMDRQERDFQAQMARMQGATMQRQGNNLAIILKNDVLFDVNSYRLMPGGYDEIDRVASILKRYPDTRVDISAHTDSAGSEQRNYTLSEARARAVADALADSGVNPKRISSRGYGEEQSIASNATEGGRQLNRRVVLDIVPIQS